MFTKKTMWEILVPTRNEDNEIIEYEVHVPWDKYVSSLVGGLCLLDTLKGKWYSDDYMWNEESVRVRIMATTDEIQNIAEFTAKHYNQKQILFYTIGEAFIYDA